LKGLTRAGPSPLCAEGLLTRRKQSSALGPGCADTVEKLPGCTAVIYQLYVSVDEGAASCTMMAQKMTSREFFNTIRPSRSLSGNDRTAESGRSFR
jgi:hypothetical protein